MMINQQNEIKAEVSMSPLIDCVFLLLIFFLVATMFKKQNRDIDINLPISRSAIKVRPDDRNVVIGIDESGNVFLEGARSSMNDLHAFLESIARNEPNRRIRLDADAGAPIFRVVEVLDTCQFRGLNNLSIRTYDETYNR